MKLNLSIFSETCSTAGSFMKKIFPAILVCLLSSVHVFPAPSSEQSSLKTGHFIVTYDENETPYAAFIAELAESQYGRIESFLSYSLDEPVKISISRSGSANTLPGFNNSLPVSSASDIRVTESELYYGLFMLFLKGMSAGSSGFSPVKKDNINHQAVLCSYSIRGFDASNELILKGYYRSSRGAGISLTGSVDAEREEMEALYSGFLYFIESSYGKKIMLRALKEINYYGGFINSLASVTGKTPENINGEFDVFLAQKFKEHEPSLEKQQVLELSKDGYISDFSISPDGNSLVILAEKEGKQWVERRELSGARGLAIKELESGTVFINLRHADGDYMVLAGNSSEESSVQIYTSDSLIRKREFRLPGIFINRITLYGDTFFLNSSYGVSEGILSADFGAGLLKRRPSDRLMHDSDIIAVKGKIFYVAKRDFYEVIEADSETGEEEPVVKSKDEISSVSSSANQIIISTNSSYGGKILLFDPENRTLKQLLSLESPVYKALIKGDTVYSLTYYNGRRSIAINQIQR